MNAYATSDGSGTVLFVDPFATICEVVALILRNSGYGVITATSFDEAMEIASNGEPLDLLLMDDELPHSDGENLSDGFLKRHPDGVVLKLSPPTHASELFNRKTLVDSVADALRSRCPSLVRESVLA